MYKVCILTAGCGSRLGDLTGVTNKGLLPLGDKAAISHIIEKVPDEIEIVIAVGYLSQQVKEYCKLVHPDKKLTFVEIEDYESENSGPGISLNQCKEHLQCPFYLFTSDCIVLEAYPNLDRNWIGVNKNYIPSLKPYVTVSIDNWKVTKLWNKGEDPTAVAAFIGLAGIKNYKQFWTLLGGGNKEFTAAFHQMDLWVEFFVWFDTGNPQSYNTAKKHFPSTLGLVKTYKEEVTYKIDNQIIKVYTNPQQCKKKLERYKDLLSSLSVPTITHKGDTCFAYKYVEGKTLYELDSFDLFVEFFKECHSKMWPKIYTFFQEEETREFYCTKTVERLTKYHASRYYTEYKPLGFTEIELLKNIPWESLKEAKVTIIHGDLHFDNVIYNGKRFTLLDWRSDFAGNSLGDYYYDLAKLYAGTLVSFAEAKKMDVWDDLTSTSELIKFQHFLEGWLRMEGCFEKVYLLAALVFLNMSPLHDGLGSRFYEKGMIMLANYKLGKFSSYLEEDEEDE